MDTYLLKEFKYSEAGKGCRMWLGDINGDGIMEIVMVQPDGGFDDRFYPHSVHCATAYDLDGNLLWQIGKPDLAVEKSGSDIPAQIYDIDRDGNNEFICVMNGELCIFDGKTGVLKEKHSLPDEHAHDCIVIADLEGSGYAQNIILKDRYHRLWALDKNFKVMWTFEGNLGHYPWPYDINGDGREELIAGYHVLDGDGKELWKIDMKDHADCIWVGDINHDKTVPPVIMVGGDDTTAYTPEGKLIWRFTDTVESQNIAPGNFMPEKKGCEIAGLDRIVRTGEKGKDSLFLFDCNANTLYKEDRKSYGWSSIVTAMQGFDRTAHDYILAYRRGEEKNGVYDGKLNLVFEFPIDGHVMWTDLTGNGLSELLLYDNERIMIYASEKIDLSKAEISYTRPQPKRLYNWTRYWGSEIAPETYAVNYITGDFTTNEIENWAKKSAAQKTETEEITRADFAVLLVKALDLKAYTTENYSDVLNCKYYAKALGVIKKLGIYDGNKFRPEDTITAAEANIMLEKAGSNVRAEGGRLMKWQAAEIVKNIIK